MAASNNLSDSDPDIVNQDFDLNKNEIVKMSVNKGSLADEIVNWK